MDEVDLLLSALPQELFHLVAPTGKGGWYGRGWGCFRCWLN
jgi:hypothetical protein